MSQLCISVDEPSQERMSWKPAQPVTSATNFNHRLVCSFLAWHLVKSKRTLSPCQMSGLYLGSAGCLTFEQCSVMTEVLSPRGKIFTSNETMKTVTTCLCSEYRGSKLLIIQEIFFLDAFRFLHMSPCLIQKTNKQNLRAQLKL